MEEKLSCKKISLRFAALECENVFGREALLVLDLLFDFEAAFFCDFFQSRVFDFPARVSVLLEFVAGRTDDFCMAVEDFDGL